MTRRLIDPDAVIAPLKEEYKKIKQAFDETSVFQAPNDVALYGALMQELGAIIGMIEDAKTIDAEPVKHGKWIPHNDEYGEHYGDNCSECGEWYVMPYGKLSCCPNCGARMDKE